MNIKLVSLEYPNREDGQVMEFEVGKNGITEIKEAEKNGEYAKIKYYEIWKDNLLFAEMHHFSFVKYGEELKK